MALSEAALKKLCREENITERTVEMTVTEIDEGILEKRVLKLRCNCGVTAINIQAITPLSNWCSRFN